MGNSFIWDEEEEDLESALNRNTDCELESVFFVDFMTSIIGFNGSSFSILKTVFKISTGISRIMLGPLIYSHSFNNFAVALD